MNKIYIILLLLSFVNHLKGQNLEVEYSYKENLDLIEFKNKLPNEVAEVLFSSNEPIMYENSYVLLINKQRAIFKAKDSLPKDIVFPANGSTIKMHSIEYQTSFFTDFKRNVLVGKIPYRGKIMDIYNEIPTFCWEITNETKVVLGVNTIKAKLEYCNRSIVAWFSPDIPASAGPLFYGGLPGLILELTIDKDFKEYIAIRLDQTDKVIHDIGTLNKNKLKYSTITDYCKH